MGGPDMLHASRRCRQLLLEALPFVVLVVAVASLWRHNLILTVLMLIQFAVVLGVWHDTTDLSFLLVIGGMGSLAEAVFVRSGAWQYANPSFLGIPMWFPFAFGTAGLCGGRMARTIAAILGDETASQAISGPAS